MSVGFTPLGKSHIYRSFPDKHSKACPPAEIVGNSTLKLPRGLLVWLIFVRQTLILFFGEGVVKMNCIYLLLLLIGGKLLYSIVLVSAIQQHESAKYTYVSSLLNLPPAFHLTPLGCHRALD